MFGALYGDVIGSYYEVHCTKNYDFEFHKTSSFTDDSVLTAAVCAAILHSPDNIAPLKIRKRAFEYAVQYKQYYSYYPNAGFGNMFSDWAKNRNFRAISSYGNGAAMRAVPIGYAYKEIDQLLLQAKASCLYTHKNREAIHGAQSVALAVRLSLDGADKQVIRKEIERRFRYDLSVSIAQLKPSYVFNSRSSYSVPPAIIAFLESNDYESAVRNAVSLGGDADTMACIAGGIAEAYYKEIPDKIRRFCDLKIDSGIRKIIREFLEVYPIK